MCPGYGQGERRPSDHHLQDQPGHQVQGELGHQGHAGRRQERGGREGRRGHESDFVRIFSIFYNIIFYIVSRK